MMDFVNGKDSWDDDDDDDDGGGDDDDDDDDDIPNWMEKK